MPGRLEYFYRYPDWLYSWGSMVCLALTAMGGLLFQNAALMHFKASEVYPYVCPQDQVPGRAQACRMRFGVHWLTLHALWWCR